MFKNYSEVEDNARKMLAGYCKVCRDCNGLACIGQVPGCGSVGLGAAFTDCRPFFKSIKINMDAVHPHFEADTSVELFGRKFEMPVCVAPIGGMQINYGGVVSDEEFAKAVVGGAKASGSFAWTGDGPHDTIFEYPMATIKENGGVAVTAIKPWALEKVFSKIKILEENNLMAFGMDVDAAALINLKLAGTPVYTKSEEDLREIVQYTDMPFIVKGVMTAKSAEICAKAGCYGIVVSNHGGRIIEDAAVPASMLREIKSAVGDSLKIFVDGGVRTGADVFKCLALGADEVMIGRSFVTAAIGGGAEGVKLLFDKLKAQLEEIMLMTGSKTIKDITLDKIRL